jgi:hypothetical protein
MLAQMPIVTAAKGYVNKFWKASCLVSTMPPAAFGRTHRVATARCSRPATEEENRQHRKKAEKCAPLVGLPANVRLASSRTDREHHVGRATSLGRQPASRLR